MWQLKICKLDLSSSPTKIHKEFYHQKWGLTRWSQKTYSEKLWYSVSNLSCGIHKNYIEKTIKRLRFLLRRFTKSFKFFIFVFFLRKIFYVILFLCCTAESCPNGKGNNKNSRYSHVYLASSTCHRRPDIKRNPAGLCFLNFFVLNLKELHSKFGQ